MVTRGQTWGQGIAIGTSVIARNGADQLRQGLFIPLLLALADPIDAVWHGENNTNYKKEWQKYKRKEWNG